MEDCLFRVPRATIETESRIFSDMFQMPQPLAGLCESDDKNRSVEEEQPIELQQVSKEAFRDLLSLIYPP